MRYFLDAEFNGFGGELIALALAPESPEASAFYEALPCAAPIPWVAEHVLPVLQKPPISRPELVAKLGDYLLHDLEPTVIASWPEDLAQLALLMGDAEAGLALVVDLEQSQVLRRNAEAIGFSIEPWQREAMLRGWDEIAVILNGQSAAIAEFEQRQRLERPWLYSGD